MKGSRGGGRRRASRSIFGRFSALPIEQRRQICLRYAHCLSDLDQDALVQRQLIAFVQLVAVLPVRVADVVACLVGDHDAIVEGVELEVAILPPLLLASDVLREEAAEFCHGRGLGGGESRGVRRAAYGGRHRVDIGI